MGVERQIPEKAAYKTREVCQLTDTQPYVLRFWESEFPQLQPGRSANGQAVYSREDVLLVLRIKELLYDHEYTITGARQVLEEEETSPPARRTGAAPAAAQPAETPRPAAAEPPPPDPAEEERDSTAGPVAGPTDGVARARYDDALEEISSLKLRVQELEAELTLTREQHAREHQRLEQELARRERVASILEGLLARIEGRDGA